MLARRSRISQAKPTLRLISLDAAKADFGSDRWRVFLAFPSRGGHNPRFAMEGPIMPINTNRRDVLKLSAMVAASGALAHAASHEQIEAADDDVPAGGAHLE